MDAHVRADAGVRPCGRPMSALTLGCMRADAPYPRGRTPASARTDFYRVCGWFYLPRIKPRPQGKRGCGVNADANGHPDNFLE
jgi:hypothetical protein